MSDHLSRSQSASAVAIAAAAAEFRTEAFIDAIVAAAAILSHADGEMAAAERGKIVALLRDDPALRNVPRERIVEALAEHEANYRLDPEVATEIAYEKLDAIAGRTRPSLAVVTLCRALIPADGIGHPSEYRTLGDIRARLGLTARPVQFGNFGIGGRKATAN